MDLKKVFLELKNNFPNLEIYQNHPLAPYTTVKIGGPADIFIHTKNSNEFLNVLKYINEAEATIFKKEELGEDDIFPRAIIRGAMPKGVSTTKILSSHNSDITILGNGSNVLISDSGIRGIVVKNDSSEIEIIDHNKVKVSSGTQLSSLIEFTLDKNLLGLEEFAYIPSTVGGAIAGNIHGTKSHFYDYIESVEKYNNFIIFGVLKLDQGDSTQAKQQVLETIQKKSQIQSMISLGSVFKNPENNDPAGMIIDQKLHLKGYSIGDAQISILHANFIVNNGHATALDYLKLIQFIQHQAKEKLNIDLELEIKLLGF